MLFEPVRDKQTPSRCLMLGGRLEEAPECIGFLHPSFVIGYVMKNTSRFVHPSHRIEYFYLLNFDIISPLIGVAKYKTFSLCVCGLGTVTYTFSMIIICGHIKNVLIVK